MSTMIMTNGLHQDLEQIAKIVLFNGLKPSLFCKSLGNAKELRNCMN